MSEDERADERVGHDGEPLEAPPEAPSEPSSAAPPRGAWLVARNLFVVVFLAVQLALPVRGFVKDKTESRGDFSWNMYSKEYRCEERYVLLTPDGRAELLEPDDFFRPERGAHAVFHRDRLPIFNAFVCAELARQGRAGTVKAGVDCQLNYGTPVALIERYTDICVVEPGTDGAGAEAGR